MLNIKAIDHIVLTVADIKCTCAFYQNVLGMKVEIFKGNRYALNFGNQKINLHQQGNEFELKALHPTPGAIDLCLIVETPMSEIITHLKKQDISIEEGPVERTGAQGKIVSIYIRDRIKT